MDISKLVKNYIFLDVDGVLNNSYTKTLTHDGWCFVDDYLVENLKTLVDETDASVILSSTWRDGWNEDGDNEPFFDDLVIKLDEYGINLDDKTGDFLMPRGDEIKEYLDRHPEIQHFVILDDWDGSDMDDLEEYLVLTDPRYGLTKEDVKLAKDILLESYQ